MNVGVFLDYCGAHSECSEVIYFDLLSLVSTPREAPVFPARDSGPNGESRPDHRLCEHQACGAAAESPGLRHLPQVHVLTRAQGH